jgi:hypothetical protein
MCRLASAVLGELEPGAFYARWDLALRKRSIGVINNDLVGESP